MATKYQTSFQYQREEKRMDFLKLIFAAILIAGACIAGYIYAVPAEKRMDWFNQGMNDATVKYEEGVAYIKSFIPDSGEVSGQNAINSAEQHFGSGGEAPLNQEKVKIFRSNKVQTEQ